MIKFKSPHNCVIQRSTNAVGVYYAEGPPVPFPNTVVKLMRADNSWRAASCKDRSSPTLTQISLKNLKKFLTGDLCCGIIYRLSARADGERTLKIEQR